MRNYKVKIIASLSRTEKKLYKPFLHGIWDFTTGIVKCTHTKNTKM